jgi:ribonuclease D
LAEFADQLGKADWVAIDTEADSLHAYPEKVCLIQVSVSGADVLIDPLAKISLEPLWPEFKKHELILHGADYDLRLLRKWHNFVPLRIFDTMLASRLLGERKFGLADLLKKYVGVELEKGSQKADWARRPLTPRMEAYARNDTHYLRPLSEILKNQLNEKGRLKWAQESCQRLIAECAIPAAPQPDLVGRVKGSHKLAGTGLSILRELWHWREEEAVAANKPPYFVLSHDTLVNVATAAVEQRPFAEILPRHISTRRQQGIQKAIETGLAVAPHEHPGELPRVHRRQTEAERRRFREIEKRRDQRAEELGIDATLIASRATMLGLADDWERGKAELMDWQLELLENK